MRYYNENPQVLHWMDKCDKLQRELDSVKNSAAKSEESTTEIEYEDPRMTLFKSLCRTQAAYVDLQHEVSLFNRMSWYNKMIYEFDMEDIINKPVKNDTKDDKLRWELLPLRLIEKIVEVYSFGAKKYAPNTWQNLENGYDRYKAALFRHLTAFEKGETHDKESGLHHLQHMAWNAIALLYFALQEERHKKEGAD